MMEKRRYPATRQPLDLDSFIANFMEDYEEGVTLQIGQRRQPLSIGSRDPYRLAKLAIDTITSDASRVSAKTNAE
jgi:hypothetical protein